MVHVPGKLVLGLFCCLSALSVTGCSSWSSETAGNVPSWMPFYQEPDDTLPGVTSPAERIKTLQQLAQSASGSDAQTKAKVSAELTETIRTEADPMIRARIIRALGAYPGPETDGVLRAAMSDPEAEVRVAACESWSTRGGAEATGVLAGALGSDIDKDVRLAAARALGRSKDPDAVVALGEVLADKDPAIQYRAVLSLQRITGKDLGNDVNRWQQYVRGELPDAREPVSVADRVRQVFR